MGESQEGISLGSELAQNKKDLLSPLPLNEHTQPLEVSTLDTEKQRRSILDTLRGQEEQERVNQQSSTSNISSKLGSPLYLAGLDILYIMY